MSLIADSMMNVYEPETWLDLGLHPAFIEKPCWRGIPDLGDNPDLSLRIVKMVALDLALLLPEMETKLTIFDGLDMMVDVKGYGVDGDFGDCDRDDKTIWTRLYADERESLILEDVPAETAARIIFDYVQSTAGKN